jgi:hypothetical protein
MESYNGSSMSEDGRVIKLFCVVGLNDNKLVKFFDDDLINRYVQKIDIVKKNMRVNLDKLDYESEKW